MDHIEKIISQNKDAFKQHELPEGHLERFEQRLKTPRKSVIRLFSPWIAAAAVIILVIVRPFMHQAETEVGGGALSQISAQYGEVEFYFTSSINSSVHKLDGLVEAGIATKDDQKMVEEELKELEMRHHQLSEDLKLAPNDERIINAMIGVYQKKLELINDILERLYQVKSQKKLKRGTVSTEL